MYISVIPPLADDAFAFDVLATFHGIAAHLCYCPSDHSAVY